MTNQHFKSDGEKFERLQKDHGKTDHMVRLAEIVRELRGGKLKEFRFELAPYFNLLGLQFEPHHKADRVNIHLSNWKRGYHLSVVGAYLAWLSAVEPNLAEEVYDLAGIGFEPFEGELPEPDYTIIISENERGGITKHLLPTSSISALLTNAIKHAMDLAAHRRLFLGGFSTIAVLLILGAAVTIHYNQAGETVTREAVLRGLHEQTQIEEIENTISLARSLSPRSQIEVLQSLTHQTSNHSELDAIVQSEVGIVAALLSQPEMVEISRLETELSVFENSIELRSIILNIMLGRPSEVNRTFERFNRTRANPQNLSETPLKLLYEIYSNEEDHNNKCDLITNSLSYIEDNQTRNSFILISGIICMNKHSYTGVYDFIFEFTDVCDRHNSIYQNLCFANQFVFHRISGDTDLMDRVVEEATAWAASEGLYDLQARWLFEIYRFHRGRALYENESWLPPLLSAGDLAEQLQNENLLLRINTELYFSLKEWPMHQVCAALEWGRRAYPLVVEQGEPHIIDKSAFLRNYARSESNPHCGDVPVARAVSMQLVSEPVPQGWLGSVHAAVNWSTLARSEQQLGDQLASNEAWAEAVSFAEAAVSILSEPATLSDDQHPRDNEIFKDRESLIIWLHDLGMRDLSDDVFEASLRDLYAFDASYAETLDYAIDLAARRFSNGLLIASTDPSAPDNHAYLQSVFEYLIERRASDDLQLEHQARLTELAWKFAKTLENEEAEALLFDEIYTRRVSDQMNRLGLSPDSLRRAVGILTTTNEVGETIEHTMCFDEDWASDPHFISAADFINDNIYRDNYDLEFGDPYSRIIILICANFTNQPLITRIGRDFSVSVMARRLFLETGYLPALSISSAHARKFLLELDNLDDSHVYNRIRIYRESALMSSFYYYFHTEDFDAATERVIQIRRLNEHHNYHCRFCYAYMAEIQSARALQSDQVQ